MLFLGKSVFPMEMSQGNSVSDTGGPCQCPRLNAFCCRAPRVKPLFTKEKWTTSSTSCWWNPQAAKERKKEKATGSLNSGVTWGYLQLIDYVQEDSTYNLHTFITWQLLIRNIFCVQKYGDCEFLMAEMQNSILDIADRCSETHWKDADRTSPNKPFKQSSQWECRLTNVSEKKKSHQS